METFYYGDALIHKEDNSKWTFKRYQLDKVTVSAEWARENNWQGSQGGSKTWLFAVPLDQGESAEEKRFLSSLFVKSKSE